MPYRRLPNTDQARIRSLKAIVEKGEENDAYELPVTLKTLTEARNFLAKFEAAHTFYSECYTRQAEAGRKHQANTKTARLYISHFIQVLNLAVIRAEIRKAQKELYGLSPKNYIVPDLYAESSIAQWGRKIIDGENKRVSQGGSPIYNPTIAKVKVHYDIFMSSYEKQKNLQAITTHSLDKLASMRQEADKLILDIWNQVEEHFKDVFPSEQRMAICKEYGLIYYYRTKEKCDHPTPP